MNIFELFRCYQNVSNFFLCEYGNMESDSFLRYALKLRISNFSDFYARKKNDDFDLTKSEA